MKTPRNAARLPPNDDRIACAPLSAVNRCYRVFPIVAKRRCAPRMRPAGMLTFVYAARLHKKLSS